MNGLDVSLSDRIAALLGAASRATDLSLRGFYVAEARIQLEAAREKLANLGTLTDAAETELVRLVKASEVAQ